MPMNKKITAAARSPCFALKYRMSLATPLATAIAIAVAIGYSIQILTASSAMVKTMTPEVIPGAFYSPAEPRGNRMLRGSPRES